MRRRWADFKEGLTPYFKTAVVEGFDVGEVAEDEDRHVSTVIPPAGFEPTPVIPIPDPADYSSDHDVFFFSLTTPLLDKLEDPIPRASSFSGPLSCGREHKEDVFDSSAPLKVAVRRREPYDDPVLLEKQAGFDYGDLSGYDLCTGMRSNIWFGYSEAKNFIEIIKSYRPRIRETEKPEMREIVFTSQLPWNAYVQVTLPNNLQTPHLKVCPGASLVYETKDIGVGFYKIEVSHLREFKYPLTRMLQVFINSGGFCEFLLTNDSAISSAAIHVRLVQAHWINPLPIIPYTTSAYYVLESVPACHCQYCRDCYVLRQRRFFLTDDDVLNYNRMMKRMGWLGIIKDINITMEFIPRDPREIALLKLKMHEQIKEKLLKEYYGMSPKKSSFNSIRSSWVHIPMSNPINIVHPRPEI